MNTRHLVRLRSEFFCDPSIGGVRVVRDNDWNLAELSIVLLQNDSRGSRGGKILPVRGVGQKSNLVRRRARDGANRVDFPFPQALCSSGPIRRRVP